MVGPSRVVVRHAQGLLYFAGRFEVLATTQLLGYPMMLPGWDAVTDTFVTGLLNKHVNTAADDYTYFPDERDAVFSAAVVSSTNPDVIGAGTIVNPRLTLRRPATSGKPDVEQTLLVWNRATKPKMYWQAMNAHDLAPGDAYAWAFTMMVGEVEGARSLVVP